MLFVYWFSSHQNSLPLGDKLNWLLGKSSDIGGDHTVDGLRSAADQTSLHQSAMITNHLSSETVCEDLKMSDDVDTEVPEGGNTLDSERLPTQQNAVDLRGAFKVMGSSCVQEQASGMPSVVNPQALLPFLQSLCSQVNHLRLKDGDRQLGRRAVTAEEGVQRTG